MLMVAMNWPSEWSEILIVAEHVVSLWVPTQILLQTPPQI